MLYGKQQKNNTKHSLSGQDGQYFGGGIHHFEDLDGIRKKVP